MLLSHIHMLPHQQHTAEEEAKGGGRCGGWGEGAGCVMMMAMQVVVVMWGVLHFDGAGVGE